jgi:hypothetical protein
VNNNLAYYLIKDFNYVLYYYLVTPINSERFTYSFRWLLLIGLIKSSHIDKPTLKLLNKVYIFDSLCWMLRFRKDNLTTIEHDTLEKTKSMIWKKDFAINLGELVYQQEAWLFDNYQSISKKKMDELWKNANSDEIVFFENALKSFIRHNFISFPDKEIVVFIFSTITRYIWFIANSNNPLWERYREILDVYFRITKINNQNYSLYYILMSSLSRQECMKVLNYQLYTIGIL